MHRRYPEHPLIGVAAIIFRDDTVLLIQRGREPACGLWSVPGGLVEVGESLEAAVAREVLEEVGLTVRVRDLVAVLDRVIRDAAGRVEYHYVLLDFLCEAPEGALPAPASDVTDCAFVPLDALSRYPLTEGTEAIIRRALTQSPIPPIYDPTL